MFDILVAGEINPDLILSGTVTPEFGQVEKMVDSATFTIGSSSAIFACGAARLGMHVGFIGVCGEDIFGKFMLDALQENGVDVSNIILIPDGQTGLSVILNRGVDRAVLTFAGLINALKSDDVTDDLLNQTRHLHVSSYFLQTALQVGLADLFRRSKSHGVTTSLDLNWDPIGEWRRPDEVLQDTDVFLLNENEAMAITGASFVDTALQILSVRSKLVVIKRGSYGALARQGEKSAFIPALSLQVVDTVGAGDTFDAGFLYGWLNDWPLERALKLAIVCGSLSTRAAGGTTAQPTLAEAISYV
jgi:sugar/nucleoside kinase (ribokinase family)